MHPRTGPQAPALNTRRYRVVAKPATDRSSGAAVWLVYAAWAIILFDVHFFLGAKVASPFMRLGTAVLAPLALMMLLQAPVIFASLKRWVWFPPFVLLLAGSFLALPATLNMTLAKMGLQFLAIYYVLALATAMYIRTPRLALPILAMLCVRFAWWAIWARGMGRVPWHPTMSNFDGFGASMVQGVAICYWFAMASTNRKLKYVLLGLTGYCVLGVVASFARGAVLALGVLVFMVWIRSPRKVVTGGAMLMAGIVAVGGAAILFPDGAFWKEMQSVFAEGTESGTGAERWALWGAAVRVWLEHPVFGVGLANFGAFASELFKPGEIEGFENPGRFYGYNTHNAYFQILAELGIVGVIAFTWLTVDFFVKNRALAKPDAIARWNVGSLGARFNLRYLGLGLEGGMIAALLVSLVYATFFEAWFVTFWAVNRMLWALTTDDAWGTASARASPRVRRSASLHARNAAQ